MTFAKKRGCEDPGGEVAEKEKVVIAGVPVVTVRGAVEWLSRSDVVLAMDEGKVVIEVVEWRGKGDVEVVEKKDEEVEDLWSGMGEDD